MASVQKLRTANLYDRCRGAWEGSARLQMETWHQDSVPFYKECVTFFFFPVLYNTRKENG